MMLNEFLQPIHRPLYLELCRLKNRHHLCFPGLLLTTARFYHNIEQPPNLWNRPTLITTAEQPNYIYYYC